MIKSKFSIKDLENLSGIKSHTIRIWEKRYNLLEPDRTDTNIRTYDLDALRKILNVSYLKNAGIKISTIANLTTSEIENQVRNLAERNNKNDHAVQELKLAMVNFDQFMFQRVYDSVLKEVGFSGVFYDLFIPFLEELGYLWQSKTINIAHEHFISHLIKQKVLINLESVQYQSAKNDDKVYVLFLPENEMHDLGLLFLNYELLKKGCKTIYLGASMVLDALPYFKDKGTNPTYITYITVQPTEKELPSFLKKFNRKVAKKDDVELWVLGHLAQKIKAKDIQSNQTVFKGISEVIDRIPELIES
ncbi:DNA-binding transcriptional MerR regulator [Nonlabens dokdonensis]|uniref:DNA-binding transcriptional MerR regulator n=2 Tax=Nonlabens dokdonensis TaxID=328515 RepID=A0ABX5PY65_9FLAO|nr:MerR family transcriptional regulator [Nonlabens dokdonensis]AGC77525.1 putative transcriptional regulator, MerR family [Nonlabens dokdonensis DSW-6]PZX39920.1 DNA-binding transcriptional MerR regulator [Nonlabens dokdonensis]